jgi:hypothetical protein
MILNNHALTSCTVIPEIKQTSPSMATLLPVIKQHVFFRDFESDYYSEYNKDGQCTNNMTLQRVRIPIVVMATQQCFPLCYSLPTCNCQRYKTVEYCHADATMGSLYAAVRLQTISHCRQQYTVLGSSRKVPDVVVWFYINLEFLDRSVLVSSTKFHENPPSGSRADTC